MRTLNEQELQQFIAHWKKGYNCQQISLIMPYNKTTLYYNAYRLLKAQGIIEEHNKGRNIESTSKLVREAYLQGMTSIDQLAERFGKSIQTIYCYLVPLHRSQKSKDLKNDIIKDIRSGTMSQSEIGRKYNVSRQYVHILKNKMEV